MRTCSLCLALLACDEPKPVITQPTSETDADSDTDTDTDSDADADSADDTGEASTGDTAVPIDCWETVNAESTVCFTVQYNNGLPPPEMFAQAPSRLTALGLDSGTRCERHVWPNEIVGSVDLTYYEEQVVFCESANDLVFMTVDPVTGAVSVGDECPGRYSPTAVHDGALAMDTSGYYANTDWLTFPTLADAQSMTNGSPWSVIAPDSLGWPAAAVDGGVLYVSRWYDDGEMAAWDITTGAPAAFAPPQIPPVSYIVPGMDVLDGVVYLVEGDGTDFFLTTYDTATGLELTRARIGAFSSDAFFGLACYHP